MSLLRSNSLSGCIPRSSTLYWKCNLSVQNNLDTNIWVTKDTSRTWTTQNNSTQQLSYTANYLTLLRSFHFTTFLGFTWASIWIGQMSFYIFIELTVKDSSLLWLYSHFDFGLVCIWFRFVNLNTCLMTDCPSVVLVNFWYENICKLTT